MKPRTLIASTAAGVTMALAAGIPAAQATAPTTRDESVSAHAAQALNALNARWNAEASAYKATLAQRAEARAVSALDQRWEAEAAAYRGRVSTARALKALDLRWNAQAVFFGLR